MAIKIHPAVAFFVSSDGDEYENRRVRGAEGERSISVEKVLQLLATILVMSLQTLKRIQE